VNEESRVRIRDEGEGKRGIERQGGLGHKKASPRFGR
jgi:hypothetical protein